jgi:hypothetical protein
VTFGVFNLLWPTLLVGTLSDPASADKPAVRYGFAGFWLLFGIACLVITIRGLRVAVWIKDGEVRVRNYLHSYSVPTADAVEFTFGFPEARIPMYEQAGSLQLSSGEARPVAAISRGVLGSRKPELRTDELVADLNTVLSANFAQVKH